MLLKGSLSRVLAFAEELMPALVLGLEGAINDVEPLDKDVLNLFIDLYFEISG